MILVTGATGFLGKRVCKLLTEKGLEFVPTSLSLGVDLRDSEATLNLFKKVRPTYVLNCAAFVGGIQFGGKYPVDLFQNNLKMTLSLLEAANQVGVKRIVNPISNCAYPGQATLFKEEEFWDGPLHESVMVYGFVRKAFWIGSWAYTQQYGMDVMNIILSNMYGPEDHFEEERSHALGALIMKFTKAKKEGAEAVNVWGSGKPVREWLHVDDGAQAMVRSMDVAASVDPINIGVAEGVSILEMAEKIKELVGYEGKIQLDPTKPDGAPFKTVDGTKGEQLFNWKPEIPFEQGVKATIEWYNKEIGS
ncbi:MULTISPECIES: NAD-dependent epimerase/dehydratase family protein [unclassified Pseudoalteromonas]|uniref:NAD-dependent epimerase/dehydratase family protein n=1 Tax=unclassified Pseudoalteromonas TaxID=194690 RepID=UPI002097BA60|nr:NAD-dependent epimerase/dehydratase family protein [Pseudoalteromonas sp. XMcav2-N]MCO7188746.1 NAD-dependent epimerase/dehydratase family protein [Pseudoalteromonas sp. XMcav2-N]